MSLLRSIARGVGYPLAALLALALLPLVAGVAVATNVRGAAAQVAGLPGVDRDGGLLSGLVVGGLLLIVYGGIASGAVVLGGMGGGALSGGPAAPVATPTATPVDATPTEERLTDAEERRLFSKRFVDVLEDNSNISVKKWYLDGDELFIRYKYLPSPERDPYLSNISPVVGTYNSAVRAIYLKEPSRLNGRITNETNSTTTEYYIKTDWSRAVNNDTMSVSEQVRLVSKTVSRTS